MFHIACQPDLVMQQTAYEKNSGPFYGISASEHLHISTGKSKSLWPTLKVIILDAALQRGVKAKGLFKCQ